MYGGVGHDTYVVDHVNDGVYDLAIAGDIDNDYVIDTTQNYLGSSARDTLIWKGNNLIGVVEDTTQVFASNIEYTES